MMLSMNRNCFRNIFILMPVIFLVGGIVPICSQEIMATYGIGGQVMDYERNAIGGGFEPLAEGMTWNVNLLFIGKTGFAVSTEIDIVSDFQTAVLVDPLIGAGYVYYNKFYVGAIYNVLPKSEIVFDDDGVIDNWGTQKRADVFQVPTLVVGYDFGPILLGAQVSYMYAIVSRITGYRFAVGIGINASK
jgi:hypothetical protein